MFMLMLLLYLWKVSKLFFIVLYFCGWINRIFSISYFTCVCVWKREIFHIVDVIAFLGIFNNFCWRVIYVAKHNEGKEERLNMKKEL
jgi:hypothetical protein